MKIGKIGIVGAGMAGKTIFAQMATELKKTTDEKVYLVVPDGEIDVTVERMIEAGIDHSKIIIVEASRSKQAIGFDTDAPPIPFRNFRVELPELKGGYDIAFDDKPKHGRASRKEINRRGF